ncbi:hypothetical protein [Mucilaginibacter sp.]|uniref:hypothetical protein n=1 Tax=Mucilaginibacter sp. TaxID=1882438 RepID=UPI0025F2C84B|nr:hypothetical protein [Mucilaginibacter sp.]MDR3697672.1 hypothetical protein [Mucilaginibacter sp.]
MKRTLLITALLLCCFAICYAAIADMGGQWSSTFNAPDGNAYPLSYSFKVEGSSLTGTLETSGMSVPLDSGKVAGDDLSFSVSVQGVTYSHKGKYFAAGDSIGMDVTFEGNKGHIKLSRPGK